jgi:hypothetical protein
VLGGHWLTERHPSGLRRIHRRLVALGRDGRQPCGRPVGGRLRAPAADSSSLRVRRHPSRARRIHRNKASLPRGDALWCGVEGVSPARGTATAARLLDRARSLALTYLCRSRPAAAPIAPIRVFECY